MKHIFTYCPYIYNLFIEDNNEWCKIDFCPRNKSTLIAAISRESQNMTILKTPH